MGDISNEPSMEDILASIKKIIADDSGRKLSPPVSHTASRREPPRNSELEELEQSRPISPAAEADDDVFELSVEAVEPVAPEPPAPAVAAVAPSRDDGQIVSDTAVLASLNALSSLSRMTVKPEVNGSDTLEGLVRDMLRPMLKEWLDGHLPQLVEGMVAKEIARITGKTLI
jgi:uncharacterized protein